MEFPREAELTEIEQQQPEWLEVDPSGRYRRYARVLGRGALKTVYWAFDALEGIEVAWSQVKIIEVYKLHGVLERLKSEIYFLKTLNHKNIIRFYHYWIDNEKNTINIITELFTSGTLRQYRTRHGHVNIRAIKKWARQILEGLLFLHSHDPPIIHRDLKCDNIFVDGSQGIVKIGDLGLAALFRPSRSRSQSVIGTPEFMAPELYLEQYNELVDIYSFGMCLLEMTTFEYPYSECRNVAQIYKKVTLGVKPAALNKVDDSDLRQFVEKCLETASRRLTARELLLDPFLQDDGYSLNLKNLALVKYQPLTLPNFEHANDASTTSKSSTHNVETIIKTDHQLPYQRNEMGKPMRLELANNDPMQESFKAFEKGNPTAAEQEAGSRDFRVKGKLRDDHTVYLRLRIADANGFVSNIHFPFNLEADTAFIVASEMVAELDLSDQDVTNIADRIDAELATLVPGWKTGPQYEDSPKPVGDGRLSSSSDLLSDDDLLMRKYVIQRFPSGRQYWSDVLQNRWFRKVISDTPPNIFQEEDEDKTEADRKDGILTGVPGSLVINQEHNNHPSRHELVKSTVVAEVKNQLTKQDTKENSNDTSGNSRKSLNLDIFGSSASSLRMSHDFADGDSCIEQQLKRLELQHTQELEALRLKHEQALQELKNIIRHGSFTFNSRDAPRTSFDSRMSLKSDTELHSLHLMKGSNNPSHHSYENSWNSADLGQNPLNSGVDQVQTRSPSSVSFSIAGQYELSPELTSFRSMEQPSPDLFSTPKGYDSEPGSELVLKLNDSMNCITVEHQQAQVANQKQGTDHSSGHLSGRLMNSLKSALDSSSLGDLFKRDKIFRETITSASKDENAASARFSKEGCLRGFRVGDKWGKQGKTLFDDDSSAKDSQIKSSKGKSKKSRKKKSKFSEKDGAAEQTPILCEYSNQSYLKKLFETMDTMKPQKSRKNRGGFFRS